MRSSRFGLGRRLKKEAKGIVLTILKKMVETEYQNS